MTNSTAWRHPRPITKRLIIEGDLVLQSAAHFGSGDAEPLSPIDMLILRDSISGKPLLPGASIAGALRNYLQTREFGYRAKGGGAVNKLFGGDKAQDDGNQSALIIHDSIATKANIEVRDSVMIDAETRTAKDKAYFNLEVLSAGTTFPLKLELLIEEETESDLLLALKTALTGLSKGDIHLGMRKNRGLGQAKVENWQVWTYDMTQPADMLAWLSRGRNFDTDKNRLAQGLKDLTQEKLPDARNYFQLTATFKLDGSILIGGGADPHGSGADDVHLHGWFFQGDKFEPVAIVPGSSFAGVIRHRAQKIVNTLFADSATAKTIVDEMFGTADGSGDNQLVASRVRVRDTKISGGNAMVQNRIRIDRFTGGAHDSALFNQQALFSEQDAELTLDLRLINPDDAEIGLLLHVLKDLWAGDLALGGGSNIGRGRLQGEHATLIWCKNGAEKGKWIINAVNGGLAFDPSTTPADLEEFAAKLNEKGGVS
jgi:CRISPR/Cas system CSM-associated protein Csm3 (group 7 of RAMP superfamily)